MTVLLPEYTALQANFCQKMYCGAMISIEQVRTPDKLMLTGTKGVSSNELKQVLGVELEVLTIDDKKALIKLGREGKKLDCF